MRLACWNIRTWKNKDQEIILEMNNHKIDVCALSETKKRGKGILQQQNYILIYSGRDKDKAASSGVGMLIHEKYKQNIEDIKYVNHRILIVTLKTNNEEIYLLSIYAPDISKPKEEVEEFYNKLQQEIVVLDTNNKMIIMGDFNGRIGNNIIDGIKQRYNEDVTNESGELLIQFCAHNQFRINNTYFPHKQQHKYTWNSRGQQSTIDYILTNRAIRPEQVLDVRALTSPNISSDHNMVLLKARLFIQPLKKKPPHYIEKFNLESLQQESVKLLYQSRLTEIIVDNEIKENSNIEDSWNKIKTNIEKAAKEAIGTRKVNTNANNNKTPWFTEEAKTLTNEKRMAYLKYLSNKNDEQRQAYKQIRNEVNAKIKQIKKDHWTAFTKDMERDLYGTQKRVWKMLRRRKQNVNEYIRIKEVTLDQWQKHFDTLYNNDSEEEMEQSAEEVDIKLFIDENKIDMAIKKLKNRKAPGETGISNELVKYGGSKLQEEIKKLFIKIQKEQKIPDDWKKSLTVPIFKKGNKKDPHNYRGITLLESIMKLFTNILKDEITTYVQMSDEQQGFRQNRSTTDAIFALRQVREKSIEYQVPAFLCFIDMTRAFDQVRLNDVITLLKSHNVPISLLNIIKELNSKTTTKIKCDSGLTKSITITQGIRQGDSLSPLLFSTVMDRIIQEVNTVQEGYRLGNSYVKILAYADDVVLLAESEDGLQRLLHKFKVTAQHFNMNINLTKTKCLTVSKEPLRCKLEIEGQIIEQVMSFDYLGVLITSYGDVHQEVQKQANKAAIISGALRDVVWNNKEMGTKAKSQIYKTCIRPILSYSIETRPDTRKTKQILRTNEMKILRNITNKRLTDRIRSQVIREECGVEDIVRWGRERRRKWRDHVNRMDDDRIIKICSTQNPHGQRPRGRPPKRWKNSWTSTSQEA